MNIDDSKDIPSHDRLPEVLGAIMRAHGAKVSNTLVYSSLHQPRAFQTFFRLLETIHPEIYRQILEEGTVIDLGGGDSLPEAEAFEKHPLKYYVSIDLKHMDKQYRLSETVVIEKQGDFFSVLEAVPDGSLTCIYMRAIDDIIIADPKEKEKLRALIAKKLKKNGVVLSSGSEVYPGTTWSMGYYIQPNMEDGLTLHELVHKR